MLHKRVFLVVFFKKIPFCVIDKIKRLINFAMSKETMALQYSGTCCTGAASTKKPYGESRHS